MFGLDSGEAVATEDLGGKVAADRELHVGAALLARVVVYGKGANVGVTDVEDFERALAAHGSTWVFGGEIDGVFAAADAAGHSHGDARTVLVLDFASG